MRLIDADAVIVKCRGGFHDDYVVDYDSFVKAPSIDIVRCKECKHWADKRNDDWWGGFADGFCWRTSRLGDVTYTNHDDFCSRGERKDDD